MPNAKAVIDSAHRSGKAGWHPADVVAAVRKRGSSLSELSRQHGYRSPVLRDALQHPYPKAERIIAEFLGVPPQRIWPSRYHTDGTPRSGRGERGLGRYKAKRSTDAGRSNAHVRGTNRHAAG